MPAARFRRPSTAINLVCLFVCMMAAALLAACGPATRLPVAGAPTPAPSPALTPASGSVAVATPRPAASPRDAEPAAAARPGYLRTDGARLVDSRSQEVRLTGVSWFGMETDTLAPHGLWARSWHEMLDQVVELGYNTIRLPYSNELFDARLKPQGIDFYKNPDLQGLSGLEILDRIVGGAGQRGLKIILDRHRPTADAQSKLWYTDEVSEAQWIADWEALARRYRDNDTVIGADLHNEPAGDATWGTGDLKTDWRLAAERAGNAILSVNPDWLIVVEGIEKSEDDLGNVLDWYWMGGSLQYARVAPVRLSVPNRLVYSAHDYGPGVYLQGWFQDPDFPDNLPGVWDHHWGYLAKEGIAPVLLGEFGGRSVGDDAEGVWQRKLVEYVKANGISYTYWSLNGNSGDTGGLLGDDWRAVDAAKQSLLASYQDRPLPVLSPRALDLTAAPVWRPETLRLVKALQQDKQDERWTKTLRPEVYVSNKGQEPLRLADVELRYWYNPGREGAAQGAGSQEVAVEWAGVGIGEGAKDVPREKVRVEVVADPAGRGVDPLYYVRITFADDLSVPARAVLGVRLRVASRAGALYFQEASYSYRQYHWPTEWERVGVYRGGQLIWGIEPRAWDALQLEKQMAKQRRALGA